MNEDDKEYLCPKSNNDLLFEHLYKQQALYPTQLIRLPKLDVGNLRCFPFNAICLRSNGQYMFVMLTASSNYFGDTYYHFMDNPNGKELRKPYVWFFRIPEILESCFKLGEIIKY